MSEKSVKYRILLLTNCDSDNVGDQVIEATDKSLLHAVFKNLGVAADDYIIVSQPAAIVPKAYLNTGDEQYITEAVEEISAADLVVVGGAPMFNYKYQLFYERTALIIELCEKLSTPIAFSAIGIEHYDEKDKKCQRIKEALNRDIVKMVTTRDRPDLLEKYITNENIITGMVTDPAVFSAPVFRTILSKKTESRKKIGIFVLRAGGFVDNKISFTRDEAVALWIEIVKKMRAKGYDCELLTSGHFADEALLDYMVRNKLVDKNDCVFGMNTPEKLIEKISSYDGVISCRLHPSIISYALDVPSVGIEWSDKVPGFYNSIGYGERSVSTVGISADKVIEVLGRAMDEGIKKNEEQLMAVYNALYNIVKKTLNIHTEAAVFDYEKLAKQMPDCDHTTSEEFDKKLTKKFRRALLAYNNSKQRIDELKTSLDEANRQVEKLTMEGNVPDAPRNTSKKPKIGIISINAHTKVLNFASPLHSYAFQQFLLQNGYDSDIINYKPCYYKTYDVRDPLSHYTKHPYKNPQEQAEAIEKWTVLKHDREVRYDRLQEFIDNNYKWTEVCYNQNKLDDIDPGYDVYICATDVIWKHNKSTGFDRGFFLSCNCMKGKGKIAYAASRGATSYEGEQVPYFKCLVSDFDYISCREKSLADYINNDINSAVPASVVIDPVFLHDADFYEKIVIKPEEEHYVLVYTVMEKAGSNIINAAVEFAAERGMKVIDISDDSTALYINPGEQRTIKYAIGVEEWLGYMKYASYIFTNSFHCCCFSIIFNKELYVGPRSGDKVDWVLKLFGLESRRFKKDQKVEELPLIDYKPIEEKRKKYQKESADFILTAIEQSYMKHNDPEKFKTYGKKGIMGIYL